MYLQSLLPHTTLIKENQAKGIKEVSYVLASGLGLDGTFEQTALDGIEINYSKIAVSKRTSVQINADRKYIEMHFSLSGRFTARNEEFRNPVEITGLQHNIFPVPENSATDFEFQVEKQPLAKVDILFDQEYFEGISNEKCAIHSALLDKMKRNEVMLADKAHFSITPHMLTVLTDIITCKRTGYFRKIFLEARVLELFMLQTEALQEKHLGKSNDYLISFTKDIEKLCYVKELIDKEPEADHSLKELSRQAGLNVFKLKIGFKSVFGNTVFGYISELRMTKAKRMLLDGGQINDIAYQFGYHSPNNFSTAFKKKYGVSPGKFKI